MLGRVVAAVTIAGCAVTVGGGCAASPAGSANCVTEMVVSVGPATATANHLAANGGNQVQFNAEATEQVTNGVSCPLPTFATRPYGTWQNPDPIDITISSAQDSTNGLAVCKNATSGAVTLTGTFVLNATTTGTQVKQVQLTCQ